MVFPGVFYSLNKHLMDKRIVKVIVRSMQFMGQVNSKTSGVEVIYIIVKMIQIFISPELSFI